ncbi:d09a2800-530a-4a28-a09c-76dc3c77ce1b [Sclerotinia trifoliorum]|uniref:Carboxylic ester hydrolase n=1 Tax=Sclerotinia trifoliorum TaxID=28548 RepID=A0A8H2VNV0_9HELO|nr:d09a2800-530a-4a28-a09c-76dc3c77ce1b [Sclerotinia trifoliorum]
MNLFATSAGESSSPATPVQMVPCQFKLFAVAAKILDSLHDFQSRHASALAAGAFDNVTYDTLGDWIYAGWQLYEDTLQTTWGDITPFRAAGGKVLQFHGEADNRTPLASSVHHHKSVRSIIDINPYQLNASFPQTNLAFLIGTIENDNTPTTFNATVLKGEFQGRQENLPFAFEPHVVEQWNYDGIRIQSSSYGSWIYSRLRETN